ncbi:MAG: hypothetical protein WCX71_00205 [Candidatus Buchananbacteria bacterium]
MITEANIEKAKQLMFSQTKKNGAPAWLLTELAVGKGEQLAKKYKVDKNLVKISLYLAHTVFDEKIGGRVQSNHYNLSAKFVRPYLNKWRIEKDDQEVIINSIQAHHDKVLAKSVVAEVVKNAECFKFVTLPGCLVLLHEMGRRGATLEYSVQYVIKKMKDKNKLLTLSDCKKEAGKNIKAILNVFMCLN